ncbi:unnamed protein product [Hyaloperonospora brassicae]|uniref:Amino acid transporter transmembrane domain-containing protein n=1 Tax=Hyaloperonospora brassicae TaxID=162125 RepID=A0AAV0U4I3_HYABA|nr:unnamed protein product [Hyaloperonospora brassicae]
MSSSPDSVVDVYAGLLVATCMTVGLCGMDANKLLVNVVTMTKIAVVVFIIVVGSALPRDEPRALCARRAAPGTSPTAPSPRPPSRSAGPARSKGPGHEHSRAIVGTILGAATLSVLATLALVGMQKYTAIDADEAFGAAFTSVGLDWAASFVAVGEVRRCPSRRSLRSSRKPRVL